MTQQRATPIEAAMPTPGTPATPVKCGGSMLRFANVPTRRTERSVDICTIDSDGPHKRIVVLMTLTGVSAQHTLETFTPQRAAELAEALMAAAIHSGYVPPQGSMQS